MRVLIADDNRDVLEAIRDLIAEFPGVDVVSAVMRLDEAVQHASTHKPHLALVDASLAGGGAELAAKKIRDVSPMTVVAALGNGPDVALIPVLDTALVIACYPKERLSAVLPHVLLAVRSRAPFNQGFQTDQRSRSFFPAT